MFMYVSLFLLFLSMGTEAQVAVLNKKKIIVDLEQNKAVHFKVRQRYEQHFLDIEEEMQQLKKQEEALLQKDTTQDKVNLLEQQNKYNQIQVRKQYFMQQLRQLEENIQLLCQQELEQFEQHVIDRFTDTKKYSIILPQYDMGLVIYASPVVDISSQVLKQYHAYRKKTFRTRQEIRELFDLLSVTYLPSLKITYEPFKKIDARHSKFYLDREAQIDASNRLYKKSVESSDLGKIYIKWINDKVGYGVFADQNFKKGDFVGEYTGVLRSVDSERDTAASAYSWGYPVDPKFNGVAMQRGKNQKLWLDAKYEGNEMRFVNHSDKPNTQVVYVIDSQGILHICYVAIKTIAHNQQVTVSYGDNYWNVREKVNL